MQPTFYMTRKTRRRLPVGFRNSAASLAGPPSGGGLGIVYPTGEWVAGSVLPPEFRWMVAKTVGQIGPQETPTAFVPPYYGVKMFEISGNWSEMPEGHFLTVAGNAPDRIVTRLEINPSVSVYEAGEGAFDPGTARYVSNTAPLYDFYGLEKVGPGQYQPKPSHVSWQDRWVPWIYVGLMTIMTVGAASGAFGAAAGAAEAGAAGGAEAAAAEITAAEFAQSAIPATIASYSTEASAAEIIAAEFAQSAIPATIASMPVAALPVAAAGAVPLLSTGASALVKAIGGVAVSKIIGSVVAPKPAVYSTAQTAQAAQAAQLQAAQAANPESNVGLLLAGGIILFKILV